METSQNFLVSGHQSANSHCKSQIMISTHLSNPHHTLWWKMFYIHLIHKTVKAQKAKVSSFTPQKQVGVTKNTTMQDLWFPLPNSM